MSEPLHFNYYEAVEPVHYQAATTLIKEYIAFLQEDLQFQWVDDELKNLSAMYSGTNGSLWLCRAATGQYAGMVALRKKEAGICEMKRLYVQPAFKGHHIGKKLCELIINKARTMGFTTMVLDTLEKLQPAITLYTQLGFERTGAYYENPLTGVVYMAKQL